MLSKSIFTQTKLFVCFFIFSNVTAASYIQEQFCNLYIPNASSDFYFTDKTQINFKHQSSYLLFVMKWQQKINKAFFKFFEQLQDDLHVSIEQLYDLFSNENIAQEFKQYLHQKLTSILTDPQTVTEESMNPYLKNYLQKGIEKFISNKNVTFVTTPNIQNLVDIYFDISTDTYVICFNANVYNLEAIRNINNYAHKKNAYYFYYKISDYEYNYLLYSEFINSGFIIASSFIHHQLSLILFILINYKFGGKMASYNTIIFLKRLMSFQTDIEIILQSINPLETAYFYKELDPFKQHSAIWQLLIKDVANMYHPQSLTKFTKTREAALKKTN